MAEAKRDGNAVTTLLAVSNADGITPVVLYADPTTHRLLVSATAGSLDDLTDVVITSAAQGDVLYYNGTNWVNLAAGTSGHFLKTQGVGANPVWADASGGSGATTALDNLAAVAINAALVLGTSDAFALGSATKMWADLFVASGAVLNFNNGDVTVTHAAGILTVAGSGAGDLRITTAGTNAASVVTVGGSQTLTSKTLTAPAINSGTVGTKLSPTSDDGAPLGDTTHNFSDLFLATGAVINYANSNVVITHSSGILTLGTGELRITTVGTNTASVVTVGGTQTLTAKTLTSPTIGTSPTAAGATWTDLGTVTTIDINGGTVDGVVIGGASAAAGTFTLVTAEGFAPTSTTATGNRMYLPAANTLGFAINGTGEVQLTATALSPIADGGNSLGTTALGWQNLFGNTGFVLNIENSDWVATHTAGILTVGTGDLRVTTAGTNSASVVTVGGSQTLTSKTLTSPTLTTPSAFTTGGTITLAENTSIALDPAGSADGKYSGITVTAIAGYTQAFGDLVYLAVADSRWELADADASSTSGPVMLAMVVSAGTDGNACTLLLQGIIRADAKFPALTVGAPVYVGETAGAIQVAIPTGADNIIRVVGMALTADEIYFNPSMDHQVTVA